MRIVIASLLGCSVRNFEINLSFPVKPFSHVTKKSEQKFEYLTNENIFKMKWKAFITLHEKYPNTEFFLVPIFLYSD